MQEGKADRKCEETSVFRQALFFFFFFFHKQTFCQNHWNQPGVTAQPPALSWRRTHLLQSRLGLAAGSYLEAGKYEESGDRQQYFSATAVEIGSKGGEGVIIYYSTCQHIGLDLCLEHQAAALRLLVWTTCVAVWNVPVSNSPALAYARL